MKQKWIGDDVRGRLHATIIRHRNYPYLCMVDGSNIHLHDVTNGNLVRTVDYNDEELDVSSISIGYINVIDPSCKCAVYLKRQPLRRFKQGLEIEHLEQKTLSSTKSVLNKQKILGKGFVEAVQGIFPSFKEVTTLITKSGWESAAISRNIAFKREEDLLKVYLKDTEIGWMKLGSNTITVPKSDFSYFYISALEGIDGIKFNEV